MSPTATAAMGPAAARGLVEARPALGRWRHEAVAVDPVSALKTE